MAVLKSSGRPRGARNRLSQRLLNDLISNWEKNGPQALEVMFREDPSGYVRAMVSILPKEFTVEAIESEMDDEQLDRVIEHLRQRVLERQQQPMKLVEAKIGDTEIASTSE
jgi:hypothetical protein